VKRYLVAIEMNSCSWDAKDFKYKIVESLTPKDEETLMKKIIHYSTQ
jgi:hypothetical protein